MLKGIVLDVFLAHIQWQSNIILLEEEVAKLFVTRVCVPWSVIMSGCVCVCLRTRVYAKKTNALITDEINKKSTSPPPLVKLEMVI